MTSDQTEISISRTSKKKSSKLIDYLKIKETDRRISLYTHIQGLLDLFIFQNPTGPVEYFEYYSEQLKLYYGRPRRNPDLDFLNNIELNVYKKLTDVYKNIGVKNIEDVSTDLLNYKEEDLPLDEYEDAERKANEPVAIVIQDLSNINCAFNKAGCGITNDEACLIGITMNQMSSLNKFKNIRYWGKIFGLKRNYYILECEWQNKELEYKLKILDSLMNVGKYMDGYENMYEHEENAVESEMTDMGIVEQGEEASKTESSAPTKMFDSAFNESLLFESVSHDSNVLLPVQSSTTDDHEMLGFGTNKKSYFVTSRLNDEWVELPLLRPHHVIQSRNVNRYFVGDLDAPVESYPLFRGLEKHYLRAQIARITAATQISPRDYFVLDRRNRKSNVWDGLNPFQSKVLSQKWVHDYVANENYNPSSLYDLLSPANWVHHAPLITDDGVTRAWAKLRESRNDSDVKAFRVQEFGSEDINSGLVTTVAEEQSEDRPEESTDPAVEYPDLFVALSDDAYADDVSPWKFETTNPFDGSAAHTSVRSNLWPGAFAVARESLTDCTYCGWGQKWRNRCLPSPVVQCDEFQTEYPVDGTTEANDPTIEEEQEFYTNIRLLKEKGQEKKRQAIMYLAVNEDDEERVLKNFDYN